MSATVGYGGCDDVGEFGDIAAASAAAAAAAAADAAAAALLLITFRRVLDRIDALFCIKDGAFWTDKASVRYDTCLHNRVDRSIDTSILQLPGPSLPSRSVRPSP